MLLQLLFFYCCHCICCGHSHHHRQTLGLHFSQFRIQGNTQSANPLELNLPLKKKKNAVLVVCKHNIMVFNQNSLFHTTQQTKRLQGYGNNKNDQAVKGSETPLIIAFGTAQFITVKRIWNTFVIACYVQPILMEEKDQFHHPLGKDTI